MKGPTVGRYVTGYFLGNYLMYRSFYGGNTYLKLPEGACPYFLRQFLLFLSYYIYLKKLQCMKF
jgi:hypothetical protein